MEFRTAICELAERIGIAGGVRPDAEGVYRLGTDDVEVTFAEVPGSRRILICGVVCPLPEEGAEALMRVMLKENFLSGGTAEEVFSLTEAGQIALCRQVDMDRIDDEGFYQTFERFLKMQLEWRNLVREYAPAALERIRTERDSRREAEFFHADMV